MHCGGIVALMHCDGRKQLSSIRFFSPTPPKVRACRNIGGLTQRKYKMWNCGFQNTRIAVVNFTVVFERMFLRTKRGFLETNDWK